MVTTMFGTMLGAIIGGLTSYNAYLYTKILMSL